MLGNRLAKFHLVRINGVVNNFPRGPRQVSASFMFGNSGVEGEFLHLLRRLFQGELNFFLNYIFR